MGIPDDYPDVLVDELAPYGFEFDSAGTDEDGLTVLLFTAEPESFVREHWGLGIEESYGSHWPPDRLQLWLKFDPSGDPVEMSFEVFDLLGWAASVDADLHDRLNTMDDPFEHAAAVGEALGRALAHEPPRGEDYLEYSG